MNKLKNSNCDKTQKIKWWENPKTQIVTVVIVTVVKVAALTLVIVTQIVMKLKNSNWDES